MRCAPSVRRLAVRECVAELDRESDVHLEVRIGINTGEVVIGDPSAGHGFVSGDAVAVGKRLEQAAAPGEIVLGRVDIPPRRARGAGDAARAAEAEGEGRGGDRVPARVRRPGSDGDPPPRRHAGSSARSVSSSGCTPRIARPRGSGVRLVTVVGESGIGKSRLARELLRWLEGQASVVVASCPPYGEGTTFSPIREAFRHAGRDESVLEGSSYEVFAATRTLFEDLARERPLVAVFDDVHWAEETLLDLIEHLSVAARRRSRAAPLPRPAGARRSVVRNGCRGPRRR